MTQFCVPLWGPFRKGVTRALRCTLDVNSTDTWFKYKTGSDLTPESITLSPNYYKRVIVLLFPTFFSMKDSNCELSTWLALLIRSWVSHRVMTRYPGSNGDPSWSSIRLKLDLLLETFLPFKLKHLGQQNINIIQVPEIRNTHWAWWSSRADRKWNCSFYPWFLNPQILPVEEQNNLIWMLIWGIFILLGNLVSDLQGIMLSCR